MNMILKTAIAGALTLSATGAFAMTAPASGSSDIILLVENTTTFATYALDTGISVETALPTAGLVTGAQNDTSLAGVNATIAPSALLASFLSTNPASADSFTLEGAQYVGSNGTGVASNGNSKAPGALKGVFTSYNATVANQNSTAKTLASLIGFGNGVNNDFLLNGGGLVPLQTATESTAVSESGPAQTKYAFFTGNDLGVVGTPLQLFGFTGNGSTGVTQSYILGSVNLAADGTLTITGNTSPVPLPAAVWLFGSGLMGLVGVSRRRKVAQTAVV